MATLDHTKGSIQTASKHLKHAKMKTKAMQKLSKTLTLTLMWANLNKALNRICKKDPSLRTSKMLATSRRLYSSTKGLQTFA